MKLKFFPPSQIPDMEKTVCVDGLLPAKLHLSHWPGNHTPSELKRETSTEIVFALLHSSAFASYLEEIAYITNTHYDADGAIAVFALLQPEIAMQYEKELIAIARCGDFAECDTEDILKCTIIIENILKTEVFDEFQGRKEADEFLAYEVVLAHLQEILDNPDRFVSIWDAEFASYLNGNVSFEKRESVFSNYDDCKLSVLESVYPLHPCTINQWSAHDTVLIVHKLGKEHRYRMAYKQKTWFDIGKPQLSSKPGLESLAQELNLIDTKKNGSWKIKGISPSENYDYALVFADENGLEAASELQVYEVENVVMDFLFQYRI